MAEVEVILKLERMGFFYDTKCSIVSEGNEIYCKPETAFASCSAPEFGMGGYCPLYEFRVKRDDPFTILRWVNINEELGKCLLKLVKSGEDQEDPPPAGGAAMPSSPPEDEKSRWGGDAQPAA
jgi:hypothetical protein